METVNWDIVKHVSQQLKTATEWLFYSVAVVYYTDNNPIWYYPLAIS